MEQIEEYIDRVKDSCIYCGKSLSTTQANRDHVPSKCLLAKPYPDNLPTVDVHAACNGRYSRDEEYVAACLSAVLSGSANPHDQIDERSRKTLERSARLRKRLEGSRMTYMTRAGETHSVWNVEIPRFSKVAVKNARGHAYHEFGEPFYCAASAIAVSPLEHLSLGERDEFEAIPQMRLLPEVGSRLLTRMFSGQDMSDGWIIVQRGVYRYAVFSHESGISVRSVMHEYLATEVIWS